MTYQDRNNPAYSGKSELQNIEYSLPKYNKNIINLVTQNFPINRNNELRILDFGAGQGSLASIVYEKTSNKPVCLELDPNLILELQNKKFTAIDSLNSSLEKFDFVYSSNVLEHIEDDYGALKQIYDSMKTNAELSVYVPAFQILFSKMDSQVGHVRRYSRSELTSKVSAAGFTINEVKYVDSLGFFATLILKAFGSADNGLGSTKILKFYDTYLFPISRFLDAILFQKLLGKNLYIRANKN